MNPRPRRTPWVRRAVAAACAGALVSVVAPSAAAGQSGDTILVVNRASARFVTPDGFEGSAEAVSTLAVKVTAGVRITPPQAAALVPGERRVFPHRLENLGNGADRFTLTATGPSGWTVRLFLDVDGNGVLGAGDLPVSGPVPLGAREAAVLLLVVDVPAHAPDMGAAAIDVVATSALDPAHSDSVRDTVSVRRPSASLSLGKTVNLADATPGDTLVYTLTFANGGDGASGVAQVVDSLSAALSAVPGTLTLNGRVLSDAADADAGTVERAGGRDIVRVQLGALDAGAAGSIQFRAVVGSQAGATSVSNAATLNVEPLPNTPRMGANSPIVETQLARPQLTLGKERIGADTVRVGAEVEYRLTWTNTATTVAAREVVLVDTLPAGLEFVRADRAPVAAGRVIRWALGTVRAGESGTVTLTARVVARPEDGLVVNHATVSGVNAVAVAAEASAVRSTGFAGTELSVAKSATVLEASLGEAIPYVIAVRNHSTVALRGVEVLDVLPSGLRFVAGRVSGADSARVEGNTVRFFLGELAPLATRSVGYVTTLVSSDARALQNRAIASAEGGVLRSDTASAWVRVRGGFAVQARTLIGKVWVDRNNDGRQQAGERGVAGVDVWSADGEVVTTDREGRFSFRDVRVGTHALRVDTTGVPAGFGFARPADGIVRVRMEGWTSPRVDFRLVPRPGAGTATDLEAAVGRGPAGSTGVRDSIPAPRDSVVRGPTVAPARSEDARRADESSAFANGPAVRFFAPMDGSVIATNRAFVGVRGEPGASVRLFDGDSVIGDARLRPDGVWDFIGLDLSAGPHRIRVEMKNSWGQTRADTLALHVSGAAERFEVDGRVAALHADAPRADTVRARVLDRWSVPVGGMVAVTVEGSGVEPLGTDQEGGSPGQQLRADSAGWLRVPVRPGHVVGPAELRLAAGTARGRIPLRVLPSTRALIATGVGQVGVGAAPGAFGAVTVRGAVGHETTVSVSVDSRRSDADDYFARGYDPNDESRYATFGDGSERRVFSSATQKVSARVERGYDWMALGDVETGDFGGDARLGTYGRALTGVTGRMSTGAVTWRGFGSVTDQVLAQRQVRGNGTSGPYRFGGTVRPGTDVVAIEVRARENAARVISREVLVRWSDYQIDYTTGDVLLQRPIATSDASGNPVFVVATMESRSGGERRFVGGARMEVDAARVLGLDGAAGDSLTLSVMGVREGGADVAEHGGQDLLGTGFNIRRGAFSANGQVLHSQRPDSSAYAGIAQASLSLLGDRARVGAEWLRVQPGFASQNDTRLSAGVSEVRAMGELRLSGASQLSLTHDRQRFDGYGTERSSTTLRSRNRVAGRALVTEGGMTTDGDGNGSASSANGKVTLSVTPRADVWLQGTRVLSDDNPLDNTTLATRRDQMGVGASYRVFGATRVEGSHRWVTSRGDSAASYRLTAFNLRTDVIEGGQMWGGLERADAERAAHSAVLGWNQRLSLHGGWSLNVLGERRFGLDQTSLLDPERALPYAQTERDRWSAGAGVEYLPTDSALRFSARSEVHGGVGAQGYRIEVAGDLPIGASAALLTRHDWYQDNRDSGLGMKLSRRDRSLIGLAMRPAQHNDLNVLSKLEWRNTISPLLAGTASAATEERRLIGSTEAFWAARPGSDLGVRYAVRWAASNDSASGLGTISNVAHFFGARMHQELRGALGLRMDARTLVDPTGKSSRWNLAPALVAALGPRVELEGGYRFGRLSDVDFAAQGGTGFYATLGVRFTEGVFSSAADFWRERIARDGN